MPNDAGLRKAGLKSTVPRLKVLAALESSDVRHMSAEDVYRKLLDADEDIGIATVYRVLAQFARAGVVVRHTFDADRAVYELNDESPHEHLICTECGAVIEFENREIVKQLREITRQKNFELQSYSLYLYGICGDCQDKLPPYSGKARIQRRPPPGALTTPN